jgi:hypothetical protein
VQDSHRSVQRQANYSRDCGLLHMGQTFHDSHYRPAAHRVGPPCGPHGPD